LGVFALVLVKRDTEKIDYDDDDEDERKIIAARGWVGIFGSALSPEVPFGVRGTFSGKTKPSRSTASM